ncbi:hypothetical protein GCM10009838_55720 [Catenulispora subtropica]|uniref:Uncharacterized protein n=1 Tax=Catenulispora subtropica TaxID=450798 RepID=A0ABP5DTP9_9ACTN
MPTGPATARKIAVTIIGQPVGLMGNSDLSGLAYATRDSPAPELCEGCSAAGKTPPRPDRLLLGRTR